MPRAPHLVVCATGRVRRLCIVPIVVERYWPPTALPCCCEASNHDLIVKGQKPSGASRACACDGGAQMGEEAPRATCAVSSVRVVVREMNGPFLPGTYRPVE